MVTDDLGTVLPVADAAFPRITVCICTHNRSDYLQDCLDGLNAQSVGRGDFAILVVDSGSLPEQSAQIAVLVDRTPNARLLRVDQPGLSLARNVAAQAIAVGYVAYLDDDAIPAVDWIAAIRAVIMAAHATPAMLGGTIRPLWEAPLPQWWPASLVGVLSIIETKGNGEYSQAGNAHMLEPYGANMIVHAPDLLAAGGFVETIGRVGKALLSDEEKVLASRLREAGHSVRYDSRIIAYHQIQADRLTIGWLLSRMYWQGMSRVRSAGRITPNTSLLGETMRRVLVFLLLSPVAMLPTRSTWWIDLRWRWYYSYGFLRALLTAAPESRDGRLSRRPSVSEIPRNMVSIESPVQRS